MSSTAPVLDRSAAPGPDAAERAVTATLEAALAAALDALRQLAAAPLELLPDGEVAYRTERVEELGRLLDGVRVRLAAELADRSRRELGEGSLARRYGAVTGAALVELLTRIPAAEAARRVRLGSELAGRRSLDGSPLPPRFPHVAAAVSAGAIGVDAARTIVTHLDQAITHHPDAAAVTAAEEHLVDAAGRLPADLVAVQAKLWRETLDPDGAAPREEELRRQRAFVIGREVNGMTPFRGLADPAGAALLRAAISERTAPGRTPRFLNPEDAQAEADTAHAFPDPRTPAQRRYDVLLGLLTAGIRTDRDTVGSLHGVATVTAVVSATDLANRTGVAWLDDVTEPVCASTAAEIACSGGISILTLDANQEPLRLGRRERYFTPAQRRALAVRDGGCIWPGCTAPPAWCHAHHVLPWECGGTTDINNGALVCSYHHHLLHAGDYRIRITDGLPHLLAPPWLDPAQKWRPIGNPRTPVLG